MSTLLPSIFKPIPHYPDSDGQPMADNSLQYEWIGLLKWNAEAYYADRDDVFVAGDHLIYPVQGEPTIRMAPDVYVAFGRYKEHRGSYKVWQENGVFPQVVFEVFSPNNRQEQMEEKFAFYERYGAEEYYIVYPERPAHLEGWRREGDRLVEIPDLNGWTSPRLGFRFQVVKGVVTVYGPDGRLLLRPDVAMIAERQRAEGERQRAEKLAAKLRELGIDPDQV
jgi:Uma2 family endonuclease